MRKRSLREGGINRTSDGTINNYVHSHNMEDVNELQVREVQGKGDKTANRK